MYGKWRIVKQFISRALAISLNCFYAEFEANFTLFYSEWKDGFINMSPACIALQNVSRLDTSFCKWQLGILAFVQEMLEISSFPLRHSPFQCAQSKAKACLPFEYIVFLWSSRFASLQKPSQSSVADCGVTAVRWVVWRKNLSSSSSRLHKRLSHFPPEANRRPACPPTSVAARVCHLFFPLRCAE